MIVNVAGPYMLTQVLDFQGPLSLVFQSMEVAYELYLASKYKVPWGNW